MLQLIWKVFSQTGNIDTYLLFKEIEKEMEETPEQKKAELANKDYPVV